MSHPFQTVCALAIVAAAAAWLVLRAVAGRRKLGCGGDCGCASGGLRAKAVRKDKAG